MNNIKLKKFLNWRAWWRGLWASIAQGATGAILGSIGLVSANVVGVPVQPIDWKQALGVGISAAGLRLLLYVNAHPLPQEEEETIAESSQPDSPTA